MKRITDFTTMAGVAIAWSIAIANPASSALGPKKPLDKFFPFLYCEEWNNNTKSNAR
jgi:hypothetical protein